MYNISVLASIRLCIRLRITILCLQIYKNCHVTFSRATPLGFKGLVKRLADRSEKKIHPELKEQEDLHCSPPVFPRSITLAPSPSTSLIVTVPDVTPFLSRARFRASLARVARSLI